MNFSPRPPQEPIIYPPDVVLASQSVGRRTLLEKLGLRFRVVVTHVDESHITDSDPVKTLVRRAQAKADEIVKHPRVYTLSEVTKTLIITADSEAIIGKRTFGKAEGKEDARAILKELMGRTHTFVTAVTMVLFDQGKEMKRWNKTEATKVTMRKLTNPELDMYIARFDFTRYAAGYAINDCPWDLITKIDGSYTNVIGLPFEVLLPTLRSLEIIKPPEHK